MHVTEVEAKTLLSPSLGEIGYDESRTIIFPSGLIGFEELTSFVLYQRQEFKPFKCLVAIEEPAIYFPLIDPALVDPAYSSQEMLPEIKSLGMNSPDQADLYAIVTFGADISQVTVNLRGPLLVNPSRMIGRQIILLNSTYALRHPLSVDSN